MKKLVMGLAAAALVGCMFSGAVMAEEAELLPGGGSNISLRTFARSTEYFQSMLWLRQKSLDTK